LSDYRKDDAESDDEDNEYYTGGAKRCGAKPCATPH
jgi:hypothetical protein